MFNYACLHMTKMLSMLSNKAIIIYLMNKTLTKPKKQNNAKLA